MSTGLFHVAVPASHGRQRLDRALAAAAEAAGLAISRTRLQALIANGHVSIEGKPAREAKHKIDGGTRIAILLPPPEPAEPRAQPIPFPIVFEDDHLLVLDKPAGIVVHPAAGHEDGTLVNALIAHCGDSLSGIGGVRRPGIVHRLDKNTSGLMVVAKTDAAHLGLSAVFADHGRSGSLVRRYWAFVWGVPGTDRGTVDAALGRDPHNRLKVSVVPPGRGRRAVTHWSVEHRFGAAAALVGCRLETGRTHQIRVHMTALGHPILGDAVYGAGFRTKAVGLSEPARVEVASLTRQALHAGTLGFVHPVTSAQMLFQSELPPDLQRLHSALAADSPGLLS